MPPGNPFGPKLVVLRKISRGGQGLLFLGDFSIIGKQHSLPKYFGTIEDPGKMVSIQQGADVMLAANDVIPAAKMVKSIAIG